jgi:hypothetical protein
MATITKFDNLTLVEDGILLSLKNTTQHWVGFSELDKIYLKRHQLNPVFEFVFIVLPFLLIPLSFTYLPFDIAIVLALITIIAVFVTVNNYRWCRLKICLDDGTSFRKKVPLHSKSENIILVEKVQAEKLHYKARVNRVPIFSKNYMSENFESKQSKKVEKLVLQTQLIQMHSTFELQMGEYITKKMSSTQIPM